MTDFYSGPICYDNLLPDMGRSIVQPLNRVCGSPSCIDFGNSDLGKAARICDDHVARSLVMRTIPEPRVPTFMSGWEACSKIWAAWLDSEDARKQREYEAEVQRQRDFVNEVAGNLK